MNLIPFKVSKRNSHKRGTLAIIQQKLLSIWTKFKHNYFIRFNFMKLKEKIKDSYRVISFKTKRSKLDTKKMDNKAIEKPPASVIGQIIKIFIHFTHRLFTIFLRAILWRLKGKGQSMPPIKDLVLLETATSLAIKIRTKKIKSVDVMKSFINRIKEINELLNCVVDQRYDDALKEAAEVDALIASNKYTESELAEKFPYLGVPISTKDCIGVKGMLQTSGMWARRNIRAEEDSAVIKLMRDAGAIPFAITNVSECCMWWESDNCVHGTTRNAYDTNRIVGGSSGGEGCLLSAAGSPMGIGSDIGGSIRMPAFFNGIFGHKPTQYIVPNQGQFPIPFSEEQNSYLSCGPMSRYATDLKPMMKVLTKPHSTKLKLDEQVDLSKINVFYQTNDGGGFLMSPVDSDIQSGLLKVVKHMVDQHKVKAKQVEITQLRKSMVLWLANMKDPQGKEFDLQLGNLEGRVNAWKELGKWIFGMSHHTFIALATAIVEQGGVKPGTPQHTYLVKRKNQLVEEFKDMLGDNGVFIYPTHPTVAPFHKEPIARPFNAAYTAIINITGFPATACPLGIGSEGVPIGIQVVANHYQDRLCLAVANEIERVFGGWVAPEIIQ